MRFASPIALLALLLVPLAAGPLVTQALLSGRIDVAETDAEGVLNAVASGFGLIAVAAPWLGTVDPTLFDPASRDLLPWASGEITTPDGDTIAHKFLMGSDGFGRDIYSRVIYGTRVSLIVGAAVALVTNRM